MHETVTQRTETKWLSGNTQLSVRVQSGEVKQGPTAWETHAGIYPFQQGRWQAPGTSSGRSDPIHIWMFMPSRSAAFNAVYGWAGLASMKQTQPLPCMLDFAFQLYVCMYVCVWESGGHLASMNDNLTQRREAGRQALRMMLGYQSCAKNSFNFKCSVL